MPYAISPRVRPAPRYALPRRVALALRPELELGRDALPARVTMSRQAMPYAGELREEQPGFLRVIPAGGQALIATLRRAWSLVGFAVDPGDAVGVGALKAMLKPVTRGVQGFFASVAVSGGALPQAFPAQFVAARAELWIVNTTGVAVHGVRATLWGMSDK